MERKKENASCYLSPHIVSISDMDFMLPQRQGGGKAEIISSSQLELVQQFILIWGWRNWMISKQILDFISPISSVCMCGIDGDCIICPATTEVCNPIPLCCGIVSIMVLLS